MAGEELAGIFDTDGAFHQALHQVAQRAKDYYHQSKYHSHRIRIQREPIEPPLICQQSTNTYRYNGATNQSFP